MNENVVESLGVIRAARAKGRFEGFFSDNFFPTRSFLRNLRAMRRTPPRAARAARGSARVP